MSNFATEKSVLKALGAKNFRSLSKEQIIEFVKSMSDMDKDVLLKCIDKLPFYAETASKVICSYFDFCDKLQNSEMSDGDKVELHAYEAIIESCCERVHEIKEHDGFITHEEYMDLINSMQKAAEGITGINERNHSLKRYFVNAAGAVALTLLSPVNTVLGLNGKIKGPRLPQ